MQPHRLWRRHRPDRLWQRESNADAADTSGQVATASEPSEDEDPAIIGNAIDAIKALEIGEANNMETLDAADDLRFIFEDGSEVRLMFEGDNWITDDHERYHVEGLSRLHSVLYVLFEE